MSAESLTDDQRDEMRKALRQKETNYLRLRRAKMNASMFEQICVLGLGTYQLI